MSKSEIQKENPLGTEPVAKLMFQFAIISTFNLSLGRGEKKRAVHL